MDSDSRYYPAHGTPRRVLFFNPGEDAVRDVLENLENTLPEVNATRVVSLDDLRNKLHQDSFDIVILDHPWSLENPVHLIFEMRTLEERPFVIVALDQEQHAAVNDLYKFGAHRCIIKNDCWQSELTVAVKHLLNLRKAIEANLEARTRLTEANKLLEERTRRLDEFSATVAHDIRGPLGGICMKLEYLKDMYGGQLDSRFREILSRAFDSSQRLTEIVQAMYEFARIGKEAAQMEEVALSDLLENIGNDLNFDANDDIELAIDDLPHVWGNRMLLSRVFINLLNNAIKYNDRDKKIIKVGVKRYFETGLAPFCEIFVEDNGVGIEESDLKDIFCMFRRGSASKEADGGIGIGLAVVQRIIELHYGKISVESVKGEYTRFTFSLPLKQVAIAED
ncbi:MAG: sensor histidine kinase [Candidatus Dadabacteria bacterium]|nr:MAG: sensor histidine kinase [Candidatus Dadabacteria bacterium]